MCQNKAATRHWNTMHKKQQMEQIATCCCTFGFEEEHLAHDVRLRGWVALQAQRLEDGLGARAQILTARAHNLNRQPFHAKRFRHRLDQIVALYTGTLCHAARKGRETHPAIGTEKTHQFVA